jgi:hypothetical protein
MEPNARRWAEEFFYGFTRAAHPPAEAYTLNYWRVVGWLNQPEEGFNVGRVVTEQWIEPIPSATQDLSEAPAAAATA